MKKYIKIFSDGSVNFQLTINAKHKKFQILEKDHNNFFLNKKNKKMTVKNSDYSSKYKTQYLF